jgi:hypothetical protein
MAVKMEEAVLEVAKRLHQLLAINLTREDQEIE